MDTTVGPITYRRFEYDYIVKNSDSIVMSTVEECFIQEERTLTQLGIKNGDYIHYSVAEIFDVICFEKYSPDQYYFRKSIQKEYPRDPCILPTCETFFKSSLVSQNPPLYFSETPMCSNIYDDYYDEYYDEYY